MIDEPRQSETKNEKNERRDKPHSAAKTHEENDHKNTPVKFCRHQRPLQHVGLNSWRMDTMKFSKFLTNLNIFDFKFKCWDH